MRDWNSRSRKRAVRNLALMQEARMELEESKNVIRDLIQHRRSVFGNMAESKEMVELRERAIEAINHLFEDEVDRGQA